MNLIEIWFRGKNVLADKDPEEPVPEQEEQPEPEKGESDE